MASGPSPSGACPGPSRPARSTAAGASPAPASLQRPMPSKKPSLNANGGSIAANLSQRPADTIDYHVPSFASNRVSDRARRRSPGPAAPARQRSRGIRRIAFIRPPSPSPTAIVHGPSDSARRTRPSEHRQQSARPPAVVAGRAHRSRRRPRRRAAPPVGADERRRLPTPSSPAPPRFRSDPRRSDDPATCTIDHVVGFMRIPPVVPVASRARCRECAYIAASVHRHRSADAGMSTSPARAATQVVGAQPVVLLVPRLPRRVEPLRPADASEGRRPVPGRAACRIASTRRGPLRGRPSPPQRRACCAPRVAGLPRGWPPGRPPRLQVQFRVGDSR
ncbi:hypothetical protein SAMN02745121_03936 [Nannocystis exedens]|uniref:Uncharacterized protein n=1 Tax=Nannocystis exedens TaxID=54 RepID=A0A1I1ZVA2_9BACT|nr:hypothetical protein NAEX_08449 [Nannocystis exedens]SFE34563.1 hypothetical protein SAMN02745121_03936 [Nannocystis exedens]